MAERITKEDLALSLRRETSMSENEALEFVQKFFGLIGKTLEEERYVKIKGLGTFKLISVDSRRSVNVNTGEEIEIPSHHKVSFTAEATLKELINKPFSHFEAVELKEGVPFDALPDESQEDHEVGTEIVNNQIDDNAEAEQPEKAIVPDIESSEKESGVMDKEERKSRLAFGMIVVLIFFFILVGMLFLFAPEFLEKLIYG